MGLSHSMLLDMWNVTVIQKQFWKPLLNFRMYIMHTNTQRHIYMHFNRDSTVLILGIWTMEIKAQEFRLKICPIEEWSSVFLYVTYLCHIPVRSELEPHQLAIADKYHWIIKTQKRCFHCLWKKKKMFQNLAYMLILVFMYKCTNIYVYRILEAHTQKKYIDY